MTSTAASSPPAQPLPVRDRPASRDRLSLIVLLTMTALGIVVCALILRPFVPGLVWAAALAIMAMPVHRAIERRVPYPSIAAVLTVVMVALVLLLPGVFVGWQVGQQVTTRFEAAQQVLESGRLREYIADVPGLGQAYDWVTRTAKIDPGGSDLVPAVQRQAGVWLQTAAWAVLQIAISLFTLFFLCRDRDKVIRVFRSFMPMSEVETDYFFERIRSMTHATIYGTVVVSLIQGALGGVMFWLLGIPGALLWGVVMALLSIIPSAGAFLVWLPVAIAMAATGEVGKAILLAGWGALAVGSIDNVLYPWLVGKEIRMHTLPVFLAILGGLATFGAAGLVIGPVVLAGTAAMVDILRRRTARGGSAEQPK